MNFSFHVSFFCKKIIKVRFLLIVLIFNMQIQSLDVVWLCVTSKFVKSKIVICQLPFRFSYILNKTLVLLFEGQISCIVFVDIFNFLFHFIYFTNNFSVFCLQKIHIVGAVVYLSSWTLILYFYTRHTMISYWSVDRCHFCIVSYSWEIWVSHCCWLSHRSAHSHLVAHFFLRCC